MNSSRGDPISSVTMETSKLSTSTSQKAELSTNTDKLQTTDNGGGAENKDNELALANLPEHQPTLPGVDLGNSCTNSAIVNESLKSTLGSVAPQLTTTLSCDPPH